MNTYEEIKLKLLENPKTWLITGVAGFIGSNLLDQLLKLNQKVVGIDNLSTGYQKNLEEVLSGLNEGQASLFHFVKGDIRDPATCMECCKGVDIVLHQAALGSVPRSVRDPITTNQVNIDGFLNILVAARDTRVKRFVYASSSSVYGDHPELPKVEEKIGRPLSPYAVTKCVNELYATVFGSTYDMECIGLRYFNIFGPRQDPSGAYAAVIPAWFDGLLRGVSVYINGDGETSRDLCYIDNAVQANILAGSSTNKQAVGQVYNIAFGERTTLNELFYKIRQLVFEANPKAALSEPVYRDFREGDVRHSLADISKAARLLGYAPTHSAISGMQEALQWYMKNLRSQGTGSI